MTAIALELIPDFAELVRLLDLADTVVLDEQVALLAERREELFADLDAGYAAVTRTKEPLRSRLLELQEVRLRDLALVESALGAAAVVAPVVGEIEEDPS